MRAYRKPLPLRRYVQQTSVRPHRRATTKLRYGFRGSFGSIGRVRNFPKIKPMSGKMRMESQFIIPPCEQPAVGVAGMDKKFAVRRIYCVGQNYAEHSREMGSDPDKERPFFFSKPADAIVSDGADLPYPPQTKNLHHEIELVIAIARGGSDIALSEAADHIFGYAVGIDLTRRDLQAEAKKKGRPWDLAKGFDASAPIGHINPANAIGHPVQGRIWLSVNKRIRQDGDLDQMIWSPLQIISMLSQSITLCPGDLIFTGTPAGVGALERNDQILAGIDGVGALSVRIV